MLAQPALEPAGSGGQADGPSRQGGSGGGRGPPSPEQVAQMQALQKRLSGGTYWIGGLLLVTVITMAIARYIRF